MPYTQDTRFMKLATPFGEDALIIRSLKGTEALSELFRFEIDMVSPQAGLDFAKIVGEGITAAIDLGGTVRFFNGIVSRFTQLGTHEAHGGSELYVNYRMVVVPWLWKLTRATNCRVFENQSVDDIIKRVFDDHKCTDFDFRDLTEKYDKIEYCVQYQETDFDFVSRLLEQYGFGYAFRHEDGKHTMVIFDTSSTLPDVPEFKTLRCAASESPRMDEIEDWTVEQEFPPGQYTMNGFDFKAPSQNLKQELVASTPCRFPMGGNVGYEVYDFDPALRFDCLHEPPEDPQRANSKYGPFFSKRRMEAQEAAAHQIQARGVCPQLAPGYHFALEDHFYDPFNKQRYVVTQVRHEASQPLPYESGEQSSYQNSFDSLPESIPFRPLPRTPKPTIQGTQTARVVGPENEEIWCDSFGRVRIRFPWDRYSPSDGKLVCWARVAQHAAGQGFGTLFTPRIGWEVVVTFIDGDPDLPLITGVVYNGDNPPPYVLNENKTQSGIKTRSTKDATDANFNEIRFEDKKGSEDFYMHAEKNMTVQVNASESETVGGGISTNAGGSISRSSSASISRTAKEDITDKASKKITVVSGEDMKLTSGAAYLLKTNMGIKLETINFALAAIKNSADAAVEALKKGGAKAGMEAAAAGGQTAADGGDAGSTAGATVGALGAGLGAALGGAWEAAGPAIEGAAGVIESGADSLDAQSEALAENAQSAVDAGNALDSAIAEGASPQAIAAAAMNFVGSLAEIAGKIAALGSIQKVIEGLLPQIPSINFWAMKDINALALWSITMAAEVRNIDIEARKANVNVKAKKSVSLEASKDDLNVKASKKSVKITGKEQVNVKAEDKNLVLEAGKQKVMIKGAKQIFLKCGKASISMAESGNIVISGEAVNIKAKKPLTAKGKPIKLN